MEKIKLSIIIPVYNVQDYLVECLDSVYALSETSKEIVIINDGSTDKSALIIEQYKDAHPLQTVVITQNNKGLSAARNAGLEIAKGKFILFLDSDDTLERESVNKLLEYASTNDIDIVSGVATKFGDVAKVQLAVPKEIFNFPIYSGREFLDKYCNLASLEKQNFRPEVWLLLVNRNLFIENNIRFKEGIYYEDELMTPTLYLAAKKIKALNVPFYNYRIRQGSIMRNINEKHIASKAILVKEYYLLLVKNKFHHKFLNCRLIGWCRESDSYLSIRDINKLLFLKKYKLKDLILLFVIIFKKTINLGRYKNIKSVLAIKDK